MTAAAVNTKSSAGDDGAVQGSKSAKKIARKDHRSFGTLNVSWQTSRARAHTHANPHARVCLTKLQTQNRSARQHTCR